MLYHFPVVRLSLYMSGIGSGTSRIVSGSSSALGVFATTQSASIAHAFTVLSHSVAVSCSTESSQAKSKSKSKSKLFSR